MSGGSTWALEPVQVDLAARIDKSRLAIGAASLDGSTWPPKLKCLEGQFGRQS